MTHMVRPANQTDGDVMTSCIPELDRLRLHNLVLRQQLCQQELHVLVLDFLQTSAPRVLRERIEDLATQIRELTESIFAGANMNADLYQLNIDKGTFVGRRQEGGVSNV
jgi:hypothetical protein